jgi:hypothetical protein
MMDVVVVRRPLQVDSVALQGVGQFGVGGIHPVDASAAPDSGAG